MHEYKFLHSRSPLDYFPDKLRSFARQFPAVLMFFAFPIFFDLILVHPVYVDYIPAADGAVCNFPFEPLHEFMRVFPHPKIGEFLPRASSEHQTYHCKTSDEGAASFTVRPQPSTEGIHCFQHILIHIYTEFLLPDRKNGLASVEKPVKQGASFSFHFRRIHETSFLLLVSVHDTSANENHFLLCTKSIYAIQYLKISIKSTTSANFDCSRVLHKSIIDES